MAEEKKVDETAGKTEPAEQIENPITMEALGEFLRGEITLQELHQIHPNEMLALAKMGEVLLESGKLDQARSIFEGLVSLNPYIGQFHTVLGGIYMKKGELENAVAEYSVAVDRNPADIAAYANRGEIYLRQGKLDLATKDLTKAIELDKETDPAKKNPASMRAIVLAMALNETLNEIQKKQGESK